MSDIKAKPLAWRRLAAEFLPGVSNITGLAFLVKTAYYKNLAYGPMPFSKTTVRMLTKSVSAYEITNVHKREPPPKEILEDVTAKGGDLLNRTLENFLIPVGRDAESSANDGDKDKDGEGPDREPAKTPKEEKMDIDEPGSTGGRVTRGESSRRTST